MGILDFLKKLFIASESANPAKAEAPLPVSGVSEAVESLGDLNKEALTDPIQELSGDLVNPKAQNIGSLKEKVSEEASTLAHKSAEIVTEIGHKVEEGIEKLSENESIKKAMDVAEKVGEKVLDTGEQFVDKAKSFTEKVGARVLEEGGELADKAKAISETVGEKVLEAGHEIAEMAIKTVHSVGEKLEELKEKAVKAEAEEAARPKKQFSDGDLTTGDALLGNDKDDFFSKAEQFSKGKYDAFSEKEVPPASTNPPKDVPPVELPSEE